MGPFFAIFGGGSIDGGQYGAVFLVGVVLMVDSMRQY